MKKLLFTFLVLIISSTSFSQTDNGWEEWQKTSCYSKIFFRIKQEPKNGEQFNWKIQFKNNYANIVSFNYHVTDKLQQYNITTHRKTINANQISPESSIYTKEDNIYLLVDKLSLSPYPENFVDCE